MFSISPFTNSTEKVLFKYAKVFFKQTVLLKLFMTVSYFLVTLNYSDKRI